MAKPETNFRVPIRNKRQVAGCEVPVASFRSLRFSRGSRPLTALQCSEILAYGRNLNVLALQSRAPNDFHCIFGNLLSHIDTKGNTDQVRIFELDPRPLVPVIQQ